MASNIRFKHPFTSIIGGPTVSEMSTFCIRFLQDLDTLCSKHDFPGGIIWCYSEQYRAPPSVDRFKEVRTALRGFT
jgi:hypothetical protein